jgi:hypothetical protein
MPLRQFRAVMVLLIRRERNRGDNYIDIYAPRYTEKQRSSFICLGLI